MSKKDSEKTRAKKVDPSSLSRPGIIAAVGLLLLFAIYMIFLGS